MSYELSAYVLEKGEEVIRNFGVLGLIIFSALNFESFMFARNNDAGVQSAQASNASQTEQSTIGKRRSRKRHRTVRRNKCMLQSSSESKKSEESKPPTMEAPALILDPTDREPGPPREIIPKHIDPAEMPAVKKPPKKKTKR
jgi:hypothetical protein